MGTLADAEPMSKHGDKLVTAQARQRIAFAQRFLHPGGQRDQQLVAGLVAEVSLIALKPSRIEGRPRPGSAGSGSHEPSPDAAGRRAARDWARSSARRSAQSAQLLFVLLDRVMSEKSATYCRTLPCKSRTALIVFISAYTSPVLAPVPDLAVPMAGRRQLAPEIGENRHRGVLTPTCAAFCRAPLRARNR